MIEDEDGEEWGDATGSPVDSLIIIAWLVFLVTLSYLLTL